MKRGPGVRNRSVNDTKDEQQDHRARNRPGTEVVFEQVRAIVTSRRMPSCVNDQLGRYVEVNDAYCTMLGLRRNELIGRSFTTVLDPAVHADALRIYQNFVDNETETTLTWEFRSVAGASVVVEGTLLKFIVSEQECFVVSLLKDVTNEARNRWLLQEASASVHLGGWLLDVRTQRIVLTESAAAILDLTTKGWADLGLLSSFVLGDQHRHDVSQRISDCIHKRTEFNIVKRCRTIGGTSRWVRITGHPQIRDDRVIGIYGSLQDVSSDYEAIDRFESIARCLDSVFMRLLRDHHGGYSILYASESTQQIFGCLPDDLVKDANCFWRSVHDDDLVTIRKWISDSADLDARQRTTTRIYDRSQSYRRYVANMLARPTSEGTIVDVVFLDPGEAEEARIRLAAIADNIPGAVFQYRRSPDGTDSLYFVSEGAATLWGVSATEAMWDNRQVWDRYDPRDVQEHMRTIEESAKNLSQWRHEWRYHHPTLGLRWHRGTGTPTKLDDGTVVWDSVVLDVTQEKEQKATTEANERKFISVFSGVTNIAIQSLDSEGRVGFWNDACSKIYGVTAEQVVGKNVLEVVSVDPDAQTIQPIIQSLILGTIEQSTFPCRIRLLDGTERHLRSSFTRVVTPSDTVEVFRFDVDVTETVVTEQRLRKALHDYDERVKEQIILYKIADLSERDLTVEEMLQHAAKIIVEGFHEPEVTHAELRFDGISCEYGAKIAKTEPFIISTNAELDAGIVTITVRVDTSRGKIISSELPFLDEERVLIATLVDILALKIQNVIARVEAEQQTRKIANLLNGSLDIICSVDELGTVMVIGPAVELLTGVPARELVGKSITEIIHEDDRDAFLTSLQHVIDGSDARGIVARVLSAASESVETDWSVHWDKQTRSLYLVGRDISERLSSERRLSEIAEDLRTSVERYDLVMKATADAVWDWDLTTNDLFWSESFYHVFGYDPKVLQPHISSWEENIHPDDIHVASDSLSVALASDATYWEGEYRYRHADGTYRFVYDRGHIVRDASGAAVRMVGAMVDLTDQKADEERIRLLMSVVTNTTDAVVITDAELVPNEGPHIIYVNEAFTEMTGYRADEVVGRTPGFLHGPATELGTLVRLDEALKKGEHCTIEMINYRKDGSQYWVEFAVAPVLDTNGVCRNWIAIERDITERKTREQQSILLNQLGTVFAREQSLDACLVSALELISQFGTFDFAEMWIHDDNRDVLTLISQFSTIDILRDLHPLHARPSLRRGFGLPGTTWQSQQITIWPVEPNDERLIRRQLFLEAGLHAMCGIPVFDSGKILGVLVLGSRRRDRTTSELRVFFDGFGSRLGLEIRRKQIEEEHHQLFSFAPDVIAVLDTRGGFRKVNPAMCEILEYSEQELLTSNCVDFVHPDDRERTRAELESLAHGVQTVAFLNRYITKSGKLVWLMWNAAPAVERGLVFGVAKDVTEQRRLEILLDKATSMSRVGSWEVDILSDRIWWSPMTMKIHEVEDYAEMTIEDGVPFYVDDDRTIIQEALQRSMEEGTTFDVELRLRTAKGRVLWVRAIGDVEYRDGVCVKLIGSIQDIDDRKRAELAIQNMNRRLLDYKMAVDATAAVITLNENCEIIDVNAKVTQLTGYDRSTLIGLSVMPVGANQPLILPQDALRSAKNGQIWQGEFEGVTASGTAYWVTCAVAPFEASSQSEQQILVLLTDVTERRRAESAAMQTLEEKNTILESIGDGFFAVDMNWTVLYWNAQAERLLGTRKEHVLGKNLWVLFEDYQESPSYRAYSRALHEGMAVHFEDYHHETQRWFEISAYPSAAGLSVFFKDVTERKEIEERIRESNERFERVAQTTNDVIWDWDIESGSFYWGDGYRSLTGNDLTDATAGFASRMTSIHPDDVRDVSDSFEAAMNDPICSFWEHEYRFLRADGSYAFVSDRGSIIRDRSGRPIRVVGAIQDITHRREYEESLERLNDELRASLTELERSNRDLEQFAYVASHDLQEPLRMVTSFLTQLDRKYHDVLDEKAHVYIDFAIDGAKRMRQIILDLLEYSRVGRFDDADEAVDLRDIFDDIVTLYRKRIEEVNAVVEVGRLPVIHGQRGAFRLLFQNLFSNALKYQQEGSRPHIVIDHTPTATGWQFRIRDNGIGIAPEYHERIFQIFQRLHGKNEYSGTGMGLAICKKIVESLGGSIFLESSQGNGSTFVVDIPSKVTGRN